MIEINEGVFYRENFKISPLRKDIEKTFAIRKESKDEQKVLMQTLVKLILNGLYGVQIRKDNNESYKCKSENWMQTEHNNNVLDY